jgi:hypothetical protein
VTTASLIRVANLDQLYGDGPHALAASGSDADEVREHIAFTMSPVGLKGRLHRRSSALADTGTT